jgi:hypothetical protein
LDTELGLFVGNLEGALFLGSKFLENFGGFGGGQGSDFFWAVTFLSLSGKANACCFFSSLLVSAIRVFAVFKEDASCLFSSLLVGAGLVVAVFKEDSSCFFSPRLVGAVLSFLAFAFLTKPEKSP